MDRRVKGIDENRRHPFKTRIALSNKRNIEDSLKIAETYFESYRNHIVQRENIINVQLRKEILNHLSTPMYSNNILELFKMDRSSFSQIEEDLLPFMHEEVYKNVKELLVLFEKTVDSYVVKNSEIKITNAKDFINHSFTLAQLTKLKTVAEIAKSKKTYIDQQKKNLDYILKAINLLFEDTDKTLEYDKREERLYFKLINSEKKVDLSLLSSGEKQLVIFFVFSLIEYRKKKSKVLLIDEPELSLHVEWQSELLPLIMSTRSNKQIIIATHSPDIIGDFVEKCVEVRGDLI